MAQLDKFFTTLNKHEGSDLHISSGAPPAIRLHGTITQLKVPPLPAEQIATMLEEIMPKRSKTDFEETGDADFSY